jgi:DNA-binding HxlR family transcriptional regulator
LDNFSPVAKSYGQNDCPVAKALDLIGERWTLLILRDLFLKGPRRFQDFQDSMDGMAPNTLSSRLKDLEASGLIVRRTYSDHPPRLEYQLSAKGKTLGPVLKALKHWGEQNT